jgi:hypothetical protein
LEGEWEVCLSEIIYPFTWINLPSRIEDASGQNIVTVFVGLESGDFMSFDISQAHYSSTKMLITAINTAMQNARVHTNPTKLDNSKTGIKLHYWAQSLPKLLKIRYNSNTNKVGIDVKSKEVKSLTISKRLAYMLGFQDNNIILNGQFTEAKYMPDLSAGMNALFVYCGIIQPQLVGNCYVPLLRIVHVEGKHGSSIEKSFFNRQYVPVVVKDFQHIRIDIKTDTDQFIDFESGKVTVVLHFRRKRKLFE